MILFGRFLVEHASFGQEEGQEKMSRFGLKYPNRLDLGLRCHHLETWSTEIGLSCLSNGWIGGLSVDIESYAFEWVGSRPIWVHRVEDHPQPPLIWLDVLMARRYKSRCLLSALLRDRTGSQCQLT